MTRLGVSGGGTSRDFYTEVVLGNVSGMTTVQKFGRNADIDIASGFEAIWNGGASYTGHDATGAETVEVFSDDANDTSAGTGARTVQVYGLDASWDEQNETVTLNGVTAVDTVNTYIRLNRMIVRTVGSGGENAGEITARQKVTTANVFAAMPSGYNQTMIAAYTIPNGKTGYLLSWFSALSGKVNAFSVVRLRARPNGEAFQTKEELALASTGTSVAQRQYRTPKETFAAKTDIFIEADSSANNNSVAAAFELLLVDD